MHPIYVRRYQSAPLGHHGLLRLRDPLVLRLRGIKVVNIKSRMCLL